MGATKLQNIEPISKLYDKLLRCKPPICYWHGPFLADVAVGQVDELVQSVVIGDHSLGLRDLAHLAVIALYDVCRVDDPTDGRSVLEIAAEKVPLIPP